MDESAANLTDERPIKELGLSVRAYNCLRRAGIATIADLTSRHESELIAIPNFGQTSLQEVLQVLAAQGLGLSNVIRHPLPRPSPAPLEWSRRGADSLSGARARAGEAPTLLSHLVESEVRELATKELALATAELGHPPDPEWWEAAGRIPSRGDIVAVFGTWEQGLTSVGDPDNTVEVGSSQVELPEANTPARSRENLPYRARRVLELREQGHTLDEVGQIFGVTRERIRQIEKQAGGVDQGMAADNAWARLLGETEAQRDQILQLFRDGHNVREIARRLTMRPKVVTAALNRFASRADHAAHGLARERKRTAIPVFSDDDLTAAIRTAADHLGHTPSSGDYLVLARALRLPSLPTVANRFGSWSVAVLAAGLVPRGAGRGSYARRWTELAVRTALEGLVIELGAFPTAEQYELSAESDPHLPSLATIRHRLGRWSMVAAELVAEPTPVELLAALGIDAEVAGADRQDRIWLAYMDHDLSDRDLRVLILSGNFEWDDSFGPPPEMILPAVLATSEDHHIGARADEAEEDD